MSAELLTLFGLVFLVGGAYVMVEGASRIAYAFGISELVVGLTIVAIGTSAPELAISVATALQINAGSLATANGSELIIGNIVGSNIANIGLILGFSSVIAIIAIPKGILKRDMIWLIAATVLAGVFAMNGRFERQEGVILFLGMILFSIYQYRIARQESRDSADERRENGLSNKVNPKNLVIHVLMVIGGIIALAFGSNWLVEGSTSIALKLGLSEYIIGLTLVAVGTSLPELATSVVAAARGEGELVIGNIIGSNIYNLLLVLSAATFVTTLEIPDVVLEVQIPLMIGLTLALIPIFVSGAKIQKVEGVLLVVAYIGITFLAFSANPDLLKPSLNLSQSYQDEQISLSYPENWLAAPNDLTNGQLRLSSHPEILSFRPGYDAALTPEQAIFDIYYLPAEIQNDDAEAVADFIQTQLPTNDLQEFDLRAIGEMTFSDHNDLPAFRMEFTAEDFEGVAYALRAEDAPPIVLIAYMSAGERLSFQQTAQAILASVIPTAPTP